MSTFDTHLDSWAAYQTSPWGRIRYRVVAETIVRTCRTLGDGPLRVLDVGGGDGGDAGPLVAAGHDVTVVDPSAALLARAVAAGDGSPGNLRVVEATLDELPTLGLGRFDLVVCHNLLQYLPDTDAAVATLADAVRPSGALSLMSPNPPAEVLAAAIRRADLAAATELLTAPVIRSETFEHDMRRIDADEAVAALATASFTDVTRYGIRCVTDFLADDERKAEPAFYAQLESLELALCDREPYVRTARFWQLVARRPWSGSLDQAGSIRPGRRP